MLFNVPAKMQEFVRDRAQFNTNPFLCFGPLELFDKMWVLHKGKSMADTLRLQYYSVI